MASGPRTRKCLTGAHKARRIYRFAIKDNSVKPTVVIADGVYDGQSVYDAIPSFQLALPLSQPRLRQASGAGISR